MTSSILCLLPAIVAAQGPTCEAPPFRGQTGELRAPEPFVARASEPAAPARRLVRATGNAHVLVILAEFSDLPARVEPSRFEELLFGPERSMRAYYDETSNGQLDLTGEIRGWVTLPGRQFDYSDGVRGTGPYPRNAQKMTEDAVQAAIAGGLDLADFDADGNGVVDALLVIHSGQGYEWAGLTGPGAVSTAPDANSINSHKWVTVARNFGAGKPSVVDYFTCPELMLVKPQFAPQWSDSIATIGVYCHEFGHILGLPDFYDTSTFENHVGMWDIMDYGTWNQIPPDPLWSAPGSIPSQFSAWSKMFLGWTSPIVLAPGVGERLSRTETLTSASRGGAPAQLLGNPFGVDWQNGNPGLGEFFLAEVRTLDGFDAGLPSAGLLLYHVDEARATNSAQTNYGEGRILKLLAQDDSTSFSPTLSTADPWPGAQTTFGLSSTPSSALWNASPSGVALEAIMMNPDSSLTFRAEVTNLASAVPIPFARPNPWQPSAHGDLRIVVSLDPGGSAFTEVAIHDVRGARVRVLETAEELDAQNRVALWDGRSEAGRSMPAGIYFFRARLSSGDSRGGKVMLLR